MSEDKINSYKPNEFMPGNSQKEDLTRLIKYLEQIDIEKEIRLGKHKDILQLIDN